MRSYPKLLNSGPSIKLLSGFISLSLILSSETPVMAATSLVSSQQQSQEPALTAAQLSAQQANQEAAMSSRNALQTFPVTLAAASLPAAFIRYSVPTYTQYFVETDGNWIRMSVPDLWSVSSGSKPNFDFQLNAVTGELRYGSHMAFTSADPNWNAYQTVDKNEKPVEWFQDLLRMTQALKQIKDAPANASSAAAIQVIIDQINAMPVQQKIFAYSNGTVNSGNFTQPNYQDLLLTKTDCVILFRAVSYDIFSYQTSYRVQAYKFDFATGQISAVNSWQPADTVSNASWVVIDPALDPLAWPAQGDVMIAELSKTSDQQTTQSSKNEIQSIVFRLNVYKQNAQLTAVLNQIQSSVSNRDDFNLLFGTNIPASGSISAADREVLASLVFDPAFNSTSFFAALTKTAGLYRALMGDASQRAHFNLLFGSTLASAGLPTTPNRTILFNTAGDPNFNQTAFLTVLEKATSLTYNLWLNADRMNRFNELFGAHLAAEVVPDAATRAALFDTTGDPSFDLSAFLPALDRTAYLLYNLWLSPDRLSKFNWWYGANLASDVPVTDAVSRKALFDLAGDPKFVIQDYFAKVLDKALAPALYKFYFAPYGQWFFSADPKEISLLPAYGWVNYGVVGYISTSQTAGTTALYRLTISTGRKSYFYTTVNVQEKNNLIASGWSLHVWNNGIAGYIATAQAADTVPIYKLYRSSGVYYMTSSLQELNSLISQGWISQGITGYAPLSKPTVDPVINNRLFKFYYPASGQWFLSSDANEIKQLIAGGWIVYGDAGMISPTRTAGTVPLYRLYIYSGGKHYLISTSSEQEKAGLLAGGWALHPWNNGIAGYVIAAPALGSVAVYRLHHPSGGWYFSTSAQEISSLTATGWVVDGVTGYTTPVKPLVLGAPAAPARLYKFYNASIGQWFYSANNEEIKQLIAGGWVIYGDAGTISTVQTAGTTALYRLYVYSGGRYYFYNTTSAQEKANLIASGWALHPWNNGIAGYVYTAQSAGTAPVYRVYHPSGVWYWTSSLSERQKLIAAGWVDYGVTGYLAH